MTSADNQQEPSMEEILASIRKIIAENGEGGVKSSSSTNTPYAAKSLQQAGPERILELTDVVGKAPMATNKPQSQPQQPSRPVQPANQAQHPQASSPQPQPITQPSQRQPQSAPQQTQSPSPRTISQPVAQIVGRQNEKPRSEMEIDDDYLEQEIAELSFPAVSSSVPTKTQVSRVADQSVALISNETALAASAAFAELTAVSKLPMGTANRTLEDLTKDLLRPLLKSWLDQNLPPLVQRLIREEIERVTRNRS